MLRAAIKLGESICPVILAEMCRSIIGSDRGTSYGSSFKVAFDC
jgi:hypothetical protein